MTFNPWQQIALGVGGLILGTLLALVGWVQIEPHGYRLADKIRKWMETR